MNDLFEKKVTIITLSVVLAVLLWLYVITEQNPVITKDLTLPVRLLNGDTLAKNDLVLLDDEAFSILLKLKGNKNYLDRLNNVTVTASVDLKGINTGGMVELPIDLTGIPVGVDVTWISPSKLTLNIDNVISKVMAISLSIMGNTAHGTAAMTPFLDPLEVMIKGPETIVETAKKAVAYLDISNINREVNKNIPIEIIDGEGNVIEDLDINPGSVNVVIPVENTKTITVEPDYKITAAGGYIVTEVSINPKTVSIVGKKHILDDLTKIMTERIELSDAKAFIEQDVSLILPEGVELVNRDEKIVFSANIEKIVEKALEINKINMKNLPDNLDAEMEPIDLKFIATGTESLVNAWDINSAFYMDLKDLEEGIYSLPILYTKPDRVDIKDLYPIEATVVLKLKE